MNPAISIEERFLAEGGIAGDNQLTTNQRDVAQGIYNEDGLSDAERMAKAERAADSFRSTSVPGGEREAFLTRAMSGPPGTHLAEGGVTMSRQNYVLIANVIHDFAWNDYSGYESRDAFADFMAMALAQTNPNFDRSRFVAAATGMAEGGITSAISDTFRKEEEAAAAGVAALRDKDDDGPYCWCGHEMDSHDIDHGISTCIPCSEDEDFEGDPHHEFEAVAEEGIVAIGHEPEGIAVEVGDVPAIINEAGPEVVIPLDDPEAVEVMAEAIEEGTGEAPDDDATEAIAEAAEAVAEAAEEVAEAAEVVAEVAAEEVATAAEVAEVAVAVVGEVAEEAIEDAAEVATETAESATPDSPEPPQAEAPQEEAPPAQESRDVAPRSRHWSQRTLGEIFGRR